jgi:hypothetical protein
MSHLMRCGFCAKLIPLQLLLPLFKLEIPRLGKLPDDPSLTAMTAVARPVVLQSIREMNGKGDGFAVA